MLKYGDNQPAAVYSGLQAGVVNSYMKKLGKSVGDFSDDERDQFEADLAAASKQEDELNGVKKSAPKKAAKKVEDDNR